ncbi:MurR/RpiR family transcriptional regulator [Fonticella tunisiensis]|uniref:MurR/RpiR family transcriptional regulator n=1 Tax=Fonticella tunisiensis TaxID=1096341 RepID=UPI001A9B29D9|nr:MurR/RpiR family transcriptional regulator [Fonticella tunisiensis]
MDLDKITKNKDITDLEQQVLEYIINNIDMAMKLGVRGVAKKNFTSTSTIMRLAKKLGYKGFVDMVYNIKPLVHKDNKSVINIASNLYGMDLTQLLKYVVDEDVKSFVNLLTYTREKFLFIYATGFSRIIAEYLNKKLLVLGKKCLFASGGDTVGIFENNIMDIEALIVISRSGETKMVLDKVNYAKQRGIKVISFTREIDNSISRISDINFKIFDMNKLDDRNIYPNSFFPSTCMLIEYLIFRYYEEINTQK